MINLIYISLVSAFVASVVTSQNGPVFVFSAFRKTIGVWVAKKSGEQGHKINSGLSGWSYRFAFWKSNIYRSLGELFNCPFCLGPWLALIGVAIFANDHLVVNWLATCGLLYIVLGWMSHD
jgi:hypothetical protein